MARASALLLLVAVLPAARAQDPAPEPGLFDPFLVDVGELQVPHRDGDAQAALDCFVRAHEAHRAGKVPEALAGYLEFLGMPGRRDLPGRYRDTVRERVDEIRDRVGERYDEAIALYRTDRKAGLAALEPIAREFPGLPVGLAARQLIDTDTTRGAVLEAQRLQGLGKAKEAAGMLEQAVHASPRSLYLYEARKLLVELGGPDLFPHEAQAGGAPDGEPGQGGEPKDEKESSIEISGD